LQRLKNNDRGQSGTIVAILMVPLMAMLALAIDVGAMHLTKQQLQTGADAAALAVAQDCGEEDCSAANSTAETMTTANVQLDDASVTDLDIAENTVTVQTGAVRNHWFAPIIGIDSTPIHATATATWETPASVAGTLPLAFSWCSLDDLEQSGGDQILYSTVGDCQDSERNSVPGGFGWLVPEDPSTCQALEWAEKGWAKSAPGNSPSCDREPLEQYVGQQIFVPIFDEATGKGKGNGNGNGNDKGQYRIAGYAAITLTGYNFSGMRHPATPPCSGSDRCISGTFHHFIDLSESTDPDAVIVTLTQ
jgi:Flp pilus assembly protein TadG